MLLTLFSQVNLREYPSLMAIFKSFRNVGYAYEERNRPTLTFLETPGNPAEGCSLQTLLPPPPPQPSLPSCLSSARRVCDPRAPSQPVPEIQEEQPSPAPRAVPLPGRIQEGKTTPVSSGDHQRKDKEGAQEMPHSPSGPGSVVKDHITSKTNKQDDSGTQPPGSPGTVHARQDDSPAPNNLEMPQEVLCTPANKKARKRKRRSFICSYSKRRRQKKKHPQDEMMGAASPEHGVQKKLKVVSRKTLRKNDSTRNLKDVTKTLRARASCAQTSSLQEVSKEAKTPSGRKRPGKRFSTAGRATPVPEKVKDDAADFLSPMLPVTCGKAEGTLFLEKLKQGSTTKCIQHESGTWLNVKEFLIEGERATSKDWKKAIHCHGKSLRLLEQKGLLFCTSKRKPLKKRA
ncbi:sp110 nuclear body protein isoform X2 [Apodemus sylvaticus]|nr:sp110 nuclear body protein isoform X2 [Apodemus sylvaticus]